MASSLEDAALWLTIAAATAMVVGPPLDTRTLLAGVGGVVVYHTVVRPAIVSLRAELAPKVAAA